MKFFKCFPGLLALLSVMSLNAQTTYLDERGKEMQFLQRQEIKQQSNNDLNFSAVRPFSRQSATAQVLFIDSSLSADKLNAAATANRHRALTRADEYDLKSFLRNNSEWVPVQAKDFQSENPVLNYFYKTKANFLAVNKKNFFFAANPVISLGIGNETGKSDPLYLITNGLKLRGRIANRIGFSGIFSGTREKGPSFFEEQVNQLHAVHGEGHYRTFHKTAYDYFDARGYFTFAVTKFIDVQAGYDKNFIGTGYRSLFLSDWGAPYLFLKLNTRIWKFNYENIYAKLKPQFSPAADTGAVKKYTAIHYLSINVTKWLTLGGFEAIIFSRKDHFDFEYYNPIIFYRAVEGNVGSPDNAFVGFDAKANIAKRFQLYGQVLLDEFVLARIKNDPTYWANKYGFQLGAKYVDAFGINNLDLQVEANSVRPFTYSHGDTTANYTHYNQPLAHPLGANFREVIGIINYRPAPRIYIYANGIYYIKGLDVGGANFGGNPFENYFNRTMEFGFKTGSGNRVSCMNAILRASYELKENLFFDLSFQSRSIRQAGGQNSNSTLIGTGIRLNMFARDHDY